MIVSKWVLIAAMMAAGFVAPAEAAVRCLNIQTGEIGIYSYSCPAGWIPQF